MNRPSVGHLLLIVIALGGFLTYSNTFRVPFQFDDDLYVVNNPTIRSFRYLLAPAKVHELTELSPTAVPPNLRLVYTTRLVGFASFAVNYRLQGLDVASYHVFNLLVHILNGLLVFGILRATLETERFAALEGEDPRWPREMIPLVSSLLFVCHPIQTQAVTYISQRFASLASLFFLLSLLLYIRTRVAPAAHKRPVAYAASLVSTVLAMLTKEFAFTLPFVIGLFEFAFFKGETRDRIRRLAPFAATLAIIPTLVFLQRPDAGALDSTMRTITAADTSNISRADYLLAQGRVVPLYLRLLFLPVGQNVDHDVAVPGSLFEIPVFLSFLSLLALLVAAVLLYVRSGRPGKYPELRLASVGILWFFITLSVESSLIPLGELVAEYRMYLPSVGILFAAVSLVSFAAVRFHAIRAFRPTVLYGFWVAVLIPLSVATFQRNAVWGSEISLWEDAARKSPGKIRPHQNLGTYYLLQGHLDDARRELLAAVALSPGDAEIHNNLGLVYKKQGEFDLAVREFHAVLRLNPGDPMAHYNLGNLFLGKGDISAAIREYRLALERVPHYDEAHNNLGVAYEKNGQFEEAIREFREVVRLNPEHTRAKNNLSNVMRKAEAFRKNR